MKLLVGTLDISLAKDMDDGIGINGLLVEIDVVARFKKKRNLSILTKSLHGCLIIALNKTQWDIS